MKTIIKISQKDLNEYVKQHAQKVWEDDNFSDGCHRIKLKNEELTFLLALLDEIAPDNVIETETIANIKNTLQSSIDKQKHEKR